MTDEKDPPTPDDKGDKKPEPQVPAPPVLPTPAEAAMNAAIIVSEMVDIDSESGAVIAAAAAAGAAIEAASAAKHAHDSLTGMPVADGATGDPMTTVKLSRERIMKALEDEAASSKRFPRARTEPGPGTPLPSEKLDESAPMPAPSQAYDDFDPVAIAAAAIGRLRSRAKTDLGQLRLHYQRHDGLVLLIALVLMVIAGRVHTRLITPPNMTFDQHGLTFEHSTAWLAPDPTAVPAPRMLRDPAGGVPPTAPDGKGALYHVELTSTIDAQAKIEVLIDAMPKWSNNVMWLELERRTR